MSEFNKITLVNPQQAKTWLDSVYERLKPELIAGHRFTVQIKPEKRSEAQSAKFHAICSDLEKSNFAWAGKRRTKPEWKVLLISGHAVATKREVEIVEGLENELVNIRESSAEMDKGRTSNLLEYSLAFCSENYVKLSARDNY